MTKDVALDPGLIVCVVAVAAIVAHTAWRLFARRAPGGLGWDDLQRQSRRSPRRYVRESTTTTNVQPFASRVPGSRITNHVPKPPPKDAAPLDG